MNTLKLTATAAMALVAVPAVAQPASKQPVNENSVIVAENETTRTVTLNNATMVYDKDKNLLGMKSIDASGNVIVLGNLNPSREEAAMFSVPAKPRSQQQFVYAKKF